MYRLYFNKELNKLQILATEETSDNYTQLMFCEDIDSVRVFALGIVYGQQKFAGALNNTVEDFKGGMIKFRD